jgi:hypothetical protein
MERKRTPTINKKFIIQTPFRNKKTGKTDRVPILNHDGFIDAAHQFGLISLTAEIVRQWEIRTPAGKDEHGNDKEDVTRWIEVKATAVVKGDEPGTVITATGFCCAQDRDQFVKKPEYLLQVAETRAKNRALGDACGITDDLYDPEGKGPSREAHDLPPIPQGDEEEPDGIPPEIRRPDISPPLSRQVTHPSQEIGIGDEIALWVE